MGDKSTSDRFLFLLTAEREYAWLCTKIVVDGRDPDLVAYALTAKLAAHLQEMRRLWEAHEPTIVATKKEIKPPGHAKAAGH